MDDGDDGPVFGDDDMDDSVNLKYRGSIGAAAQVSQWRNHKYDQDESLRLAEEPDSDNLAETDDEKGEVNMGESSLYSDAADDHTDQENGESESHGRLPRRQRRNGSADGADEKAAQVPTTTRPEPQGYQPQRNRGSDSSVDDSNQDAIESQMLNKKAWTAAKALGKIAFVAAADYYSNYTDDTYEIADHILKEPRFFQAAFYGDLSAMKKMYKGGAVDASAAAGDFFQGDTPLHAASRNGHLDIVSLMLSMNCKEHRRNLNGETAIYLASMNGHLDCCKLLAQKGAHKDQTDKSGRTPLLAASTNGHLDVVRYLVETGASKFKVSKDGKNLMYAACENGHLNIVLYLLQTSKSKKKKLKVNRSGTITDQVNTHISSKAGSEVGESMMAQPANPKTVEFKDRPSRFGVTPLAIAAKNGHVDIVRSLLKSGCMREACDMEGNTPLLFACMQDKNPDRQKQVVDVLIEAVIHVNAKDTGKRTALFKAASCGNSDVCKSLIEFDANIQEPDAFGWTPLHAAADKGHAATVALLLQMGARNDSETDEKGTPLWHAARGGHTDCVKLLVKCKKHCVNAANAKGESPVYAACAGGHVATVRMLIESKADLRQTRSECRTSPIGCAAKNGHSDVVNTLLRSGQDVNIRDVKGRTPLYLAAEYGHVMVCQCLIDWHGCILDSEDEEGRSPLMAACLKQHLDVFEFLLENDCNMSHTNHLGETTMHKACEVGFLDSVRLLVVAGARKNKAVQDTLMTPLMLAASGGHLHVTQFLTASNAKLNLENDLNQTALQLAAMNGHVNIVEHLLACGSDLNVEDINAETPLVAACARGHLEVVERLVEAGTNVNHYNKNGTTSPLFASAGAGHMDIARYLLENGAEVDHKLSSDGTTALYIAAETGKLAVVETLLAGDADVMISRSNGWTPLHIAAFQGHYEVLQLLCDHKQVDLNPVTKNGSTPLFIASQVGSPDCVKVFCDIYADSNSQGRARVNLDARRGEMGPTPIMITAKHGHVECAQMLLQAGANKDLQTQCKNTALHIAAFHGQMQVLRLLVDADANPLVDFGDASQKYELVYESELFSHPGKKLIKTKHLQQPKSASSEATPQRSEKTRKKHKRRVPKANNKLTVLPNDAPSLEA